MRGAGSEVAELKEQQAIIVSQSVRLKERFSQSLSLLRAHRKVPVRVSRLLTRGLLMEAESQHKASVFAPLGPRHWEWKPAG